MCIAHGPRFNIKMSSYQYRKSHCGDKTVVRSSYLHNRVSYTGKLAYLYWIGARAIPWISAYKLVIGLSPINFSEISAHVQILLSRKCIWICRLLAKISAILFRPWNTKADYDSTRGTTVHQTWAGSKVKLPGGHVMISLKFYNSFEDLVISSKGSRFSNE